ncbi:hyaluronan-binding protein 2-like [Lampris incognitus]|uniref:hyaluronan-binding protein 2-like n=1 Tax=Lampris incognitus TaxID=2546036 RepID=UPI0024B4ECA4|nr:hyaluronan-binding protein 2-like [Lampris incognitus]
MNLKLLFFCLVLLVLAIPAELKREKRHIRHGWHGHVQRHGHAKHIKKYGRYMDFIQDYFFQLVDVDDDDDDDDDNNPDWILKIQGPAGQCNPNPCLNNGVCEERGWRIFRCDCPEPFKGRKCERVPKICKRGLCGRGECVLTSTPPFYECKCKKPFVPPHCDSVMVCNPNPCANGGICIRDGMDFDCECPPGFTGRFCHVGPNDCYIGDGESYRGNVSETDDGDECLYWNSHFILEEGIDPFSSYKNNDGLGPHNFCRNPDGDSMPWCFIRRGRKLLWDYCDVTECRGPTAVPPPKAPTEAPTKAPIVPPRPQPTQASSRLSTEKPTEALAPLPKPTEVTDQTTTEPQQFSTCGKSQPKKSFKRIFGGLKVSPGTHPWQVSVQTRKKGSNHGYSHICGGVLIDSCWVLTAGHCIDNNYDMEVVTGSVSLDSDEPTEQTLQVEDAIIHENYREAPDAVYNDIGLLKLKGRDGTCANETQFVKAACLPDITLPDGMECTISGWGATEQSAFGSNHLLDAKVMLINHEKCSEKKIYGSVLDNSMLCAGHLQGGVDSCQGDSGGPLTCDQHGSHVIYGLVSWGDQCGRKLKPGVYTRVTNFLDWIKAKKRAIST